jgi:hypothetical protein
MSIRDRYYVMVMGNGRPDRGVDAEVCCPAGNQDAARLHSIQQICERRTNIRVVQGLLDHHIIWATNQFGEKIPPWRISRKAVTRSAAVSYPYDFATLLPHFLRQRIDAIDHTLQIVFGFAVQQADLHIHYDKRIHDAAPCGWVL